MSQFKSRFQAPPSRTTREPELRLRVPAGKHSHDYAESPYGNPRSGSQKISDLSFWDNRDPEEREEEEWQDRQSPVPFILVAIVLVVATTLLWFAFRWMTGEGSSTPPIIAADTTPFKVRPENPGGMMIPHQDKLVYGRLSQDSSQPMERLLPPPEQPIFDRPMGPPQSIPNQPQYYRGPPPPYQNPQGQNHRGYVAPQQNPAPGYAPPPMVHQYPQSQAQYQQHPQPHQPQNDQPFQGTSTYPQQQYPQPPHGAQPTHGQHAYPPPPQESTLYETGTQDPSNNIPPPLPQNPYSTPTSSAPSKKHISVVEEIKPATDEEATQKPPVRKTSVPKQKEMSELDQLIAEEVQKSSHHSESKDKGKNPKLMAISPGKHKVQIASLPTRAMAEQEIKRLRAQNKDTFQGQRWNIQKLNLGPNKGFTHRIVVGSFPNRTAASRFCKRLRSEKIGCMVIAPAND